MLRHPLVLVATLSASLAAAAQPPTQTPVPAGLVAAAHQEPLGFAMALSDAAIPNGLETRGPAQRPRQKPDFDLARQSTVPLRQVVNEFNKSHADYQAEIVDGVVVVRPQGNKAAYLDAPSTVEPGPVDGAMTAARKIFRGLDPRLGDGGGIVGSSINTSADERGEFNTVLLDGHGRSVIGVLNQLAKQSGRGWLVVTSDEKGSSRVRAFGLVHRHGSITSVQLN
jgi:hypothetical protein